jgi:hypothetical protein
MWWWVPQATTTIREGSERKEQRQVRGAAWLRRCLDLRAINRASCTRFRALNPHEWALHQQVLLRQKRRTGAFYSVVRVRDVLQASF